MNKFFLLVSVCVFMLTVFSCTKTEENGGENDEQNVTAVKTEQVLTSTLWKFIELNGDIRAEKSLKVYSAMAGKISGTPVHLGSKVKKGDVVAYVDPSSPGSYYRLNEVTSPINGTVISIPLKDGTRVNTETAIVSIGDLSNLQIIAYVPERYVSYLKTGLKADIMLEPYPDEVFPAEIKEISPVVDEATRTKEVVLAFNKEDSRNTTD
ncbi:MAG: efflux RND transporter periplasmic adaptor subunit [Treponema sp.]|nr:efflux RND transporter periplasmic adaptor subunit [Treponema sp.]